VPNAGVVFPPDQLPGFTDRHTFVSVEGFAAVRTAEPALNPRRGGRYRAAVSRYIDTSRTADQFTRVDVDLQQYASVLNERRVFVVRALGSFTDVDQGATLPFYLMRTLGGGQTLRGFRDFRFRDRHLLALQAEYRWEILTALDGALFYEVGQVAPRLDRFRIRDFERDWGFGLRFGGNGGVFLRLDLAYGGEGPRTWLRFGHVF
jgi:outer membrane translocation and assembly module TamA